MIETTWEVSGGEIHTGNSDGCTRRESGSGKSMLLRSRSCSTDSAHSRGMLTDPMRLCAWMYLSNNYTVKDWVGIAEVFGMLASTIRAQAGPTVMPL